MTTVPTFDTDSGRHVVTAAACRTIVV